MWRTSTERPGESRATLRFAIGVLIAATYALLWDISPASLPPILTALLLRPGTPLTPLRTAVALVLLIYITFMVGHYAADLLHVTTGLLVVVVAWLVYLCFYASASGAPSIVVTFSLVAVLLVPVTFMASVEAANALAGSMATTFVSSMAICYLMHALLPARDGEVDMPPTVAGQKRDPITSHRRAVRSTMVMMPVFYGYLVFSHAEYVTALIYVGLILLSADAEASAARGRNWIGANVVGGFAAATLFVINIAVGSLGFAVLSVFFAALVFGSKMARLPLKRSVLGDAVTAFLLVFTAENAGSEVAARLLQVFAVIAYVGTMTSALSPNASPSSRGEMALA